MFRRCAFRGGVSGMTAHLDDTFGPGIKLRRITVVMTDAAVATGIEKRLLWLPPLYNGGMLGGQKFYDEQRPELNEAFLDFKQGADR